MFDQHVVAIDAAAESALAAVDEVETVVLDVEAHHVTAWRESEQRRL